MSFFKLFMIFFQKALQLYESTPSPLLPGQDQEDGDQAEGDDEEGEGYGMVKEGLHGRSPRYPSSTAKLSFDRE